MYDAADSDSRFGSDGAERIIMTIEQEKYDCPKLSNYFGGKEYMPQDPSVKVHV